MDEWSKPRIKLWFKLCPRINALFAQNDEEVALIGSGFDSPNSTSVCTTGGGPFKWWYSGSQQSNFAGAPYSLIFFSPLFLTLQIRAIITTNKISLLHTLSLRSTKPINPSILTDNPRITDNKLPLHKHTQNRPNPQPVPASYKTLSRRPSFSFIQLRYLAFLRFPSRRPRTHIPDPIPARHMALSRRPIVVFRLGNNRCKVHHHSNVLVGWAAIANKKNDSAEL